VARGDDKPVEPGIGQTLRVQALRARSSDLGPDPRTSSGPTAPTAQRHRRFLSCTEWVVHTWIRTGE
jgi:hypothetical protein